MKNILKKAILTLPKHLAILIVFCVTTIGFSPLSAQSKTDKVIDNETDNWAEERLHSMTLEEKIAQITMLRIHSNFDATYEQQMIDEIRKYQPGGVCFFQGGPKREINLTNKIQKASKIPLLISIDGEWGVAMRLDSVLGFPRQMTLGALAQEDEHLIYEMGKEVGRQCREMGIHINFAPCIDINNNAENPVINSRSFGENRESVVRKGRLYMLGMQDAGLLTCLKHFPGHGDTESDSHKTLPVISKSFEALDSLELYPFRELIKSGADMVMVAHLNVPALDDEKNSISSLSYNIITDLLKKEYGFDGIVITDALDMNGVRKIYPGGGEAEIKALLAGVDILLLPNKLSIVIPAIKKAVESGLIPEELINEKCLNVLRLKEKMNLKEFVPIDTQNIYRRLTTENTENILQNIINQSITLLKNEKFALPIQQADTNESIVIFMGRTEDSTAYQDICKELQIKYLHISSTISKEEQDTLVAKISPYEKVVFLLLNTNQSPVYNYGIVETNTELIKRICRQKTTILALMGNPYALNKLGNIDSCRAIIVGYQPTVSTVKSTLSKIYGTGDYNGHLPVRIESHSNTAGISLARQVEIQKSGYSILDEKCNRKIDSMILNGIKEKIFPGCQILAVQNGKTVYHKNFGRLTYDHESPAVNDETLYDIASMTKPTATTLAVMKLYEEGKFKLTDSIGNYLPYLKNTDKTDITIEELLTHTSGFLAYIPFYKKICADKANREHYFSKEKTEKFNIQVADNLYLRYDYIDSMRNSIAHSRLSEKKYVYSDLNFVLLKELVETLTGTTLEDYVETNFYQPLGLKNTSFHPLNTFEKKKIAPTENDKWFRYQIVQGYVHDQTSALFGGVAGNAGLFSTVSDLCVIYQMLLNGGIYDGKRYFDSETVDLFTSAHPIHNCEVRGLGFHTPSYPTPSALVPALSGKNTFGHQGFTGTVFWCDPETKLIYLFLSNRVYPDSEPNKLSKSGIRLHVHRIICEGLNQK